MYMYAVRDNINYNLLHILQMLWYDVHILRNAFIAFTALNPICMLWA